MISQRWFGHRRSAFLGAPLRQQGELIGTLTARRTEVRPFTPAQIKLLQTFADQAVIAIENVRLVPRTKGVVRATDRDERNSWRDCQLADGCCSQCWMSSQKTLRACVARRMRRFALFKGTCSD